MILSLGFVKKTVGGYISYINPNETGKYSFIGILIYGFLLAVLFIAFKKLL
jgi:fructose-specific phosphotransferase system IIC component